MNMTSSWLQTAIAFVLGIMGTILVSIVANLLTPDRATLVSRYKDWRAKSSSRAARIRIRELESELSIVEYHAQNEPRFILFLFGQLFNLLMYIMQGLFAFGFNAFFQAVLSQESPPPPEILSNSIASIFGVIFFWNIVRALFAVDEVNKIITNIRSYSNYKSKTELRIEGLRNIATAEGKVQ